MRAPEVIAFGDIRVDLARLEVTRDGQAVALEPKAFDVLRMLIEHRDRLITKDELLDAVWRDTFVTPNVLTRVVAQLRKGLGDDAHDAKYIETVSKRGYRFIAQVEAGAPAATPSRGPEDPRRGAGSSRRVWRSGASAKMLTATALIAAAVALLWLLRPASNPTPVADAAARAPLQRLTTRMGYHLTPALSPDGRTIAYASDATGGLEIYLSALTPGAHEVAITSDGGQNMQPAWSPDGRWIAFHSRTRRGVWVVPATGGTPLQAVEFGSDPSWSPDSEEIVVTSEAGGMAGQSTLWIVARDGSRRHPLTRTGEPAGSHRAPTWSGSGRHVAFLVGNRWNSELWVVGAGGGDTWRVASATAGADPQFDAGDHAIYWTGRNADDTDTTLWRVGFDPESGRGVGQPAVARSLGVGTVEGWSLSSTGTLAFAATSLDMNLWAVDLDAHGATREPMRLTSDTVRNGQPTYAPDRRVTFIQHGAGRPLLSWVMRDDGRDRELILGDTVARNPLWSRDGSRVLVVRDTPNPTLWWVDATTRRPTETPVSGADINSPALSPDSRLVAFHVVDPSGIMNVWIQPLDGGPRRRVTREPEAASYAAWAPDGQSLAVEIKRGDQTHVGIVPSAGGAVEPLTGDTGQSWPHSWSPDGRQIAFAGERNGVWNIYAVSTATRTVTPLTRLTSSSGWVRYPAWSPSGTRLVFERNIQTGTIWTMMLPQSLEATE